jgi:hypothetical protein
MFPASVLRRLVLPLAGLALVAAATVWADEPKKPGHGPKGKPEKSEATANPAPSKGNAPPAPPPVVFRQEPEVILVPSTRVYYVPDLKYDLFRYGRHWYINSGGHWYRARGYSGPYEYLENERVPSTILRLPDKYHRQPMRPANGSH